MYPLAPHEACACPKDSPSSQMGSADFHPNLFWRPTTGLVLVETTEENCALQRFCRDGVRPHVRSRPFMTFRAHMQVPVSLASAVCAMQTGGWSVSEWRFARIWTSAAFNVHVSARIQLGMLRGNRSAPRKEELKPLCGTQSLCPTGASDSQSLMACSHARESHYPINELCLCVTRV